VAAGSGVAELSTPDSAGVPTAIAGLTLSVPYNNLAAVEQAFAAQPGRIAAIIVEPVAANMGLVLPAEDFLAGLRAVCDRQGALLIFDEVITGFRVHPGGAQARFGVKADLATYGKIIGGGFPAAAYGGRRELMELVAPSGLVYQAGTLSGNPVAMAAGAATLLELLRPGVQEGLARRSAAFASGLQAWAAARGASAQACGSLMGLCFRPQPPRDWAEVLQADQAAYAGFFHAALDHGLYFAPSPFESLFISTAHGERELAQALRVLEGLPA
jgi:glutamate-1-semialdehyde 2,1-aminomutase